MDRLCKFIHKYFYDIINFITNGLLEGMNSKIQFIKRATRGYRCTENFLLLVKHAFEHFGVRLNQSLSSLSQIINP